MKLIRSDRWQLAPTTRQREDLEWTELLYRQYVEALTGVVYTHWLEIADAESQCAAVEQLVHATKVNKAPKYHVNQV